MSVISELQARNMYHSCTDESIVGAGKLTVYAGFDATARSLHVGNLTTLMALRIFKKHGHKIIVLLGGATTKIGDPSGKNEMRKILTDQEIESNKASIGECVLKIIPDAQIVDNSDWFKSIGYIELLRDIGSCFSINRMLTMDSVKTRLEKASSLSFLEFNYMILQSYDFWHLYKNFGCNVQIGGSDQWGNIVCGIDLIHKKNPEAKTFGVTSPLITLSNGKKMGKSEQGAVWLSPDMLSDFEYFQYFRNTPDEDVIKMMKIFTDLDPQEIDKMCNCNTNINDIKKTLSFEATKLCRGGNAAEKCRQQAEKLFVSSTIDTESAIHISSASISILDLITKVGAVSSNGEGRRLVLAGGVKIDNQTVSDIKTILANKDYFKLSVGKKRIFTVKLGTN